MGSEITSRRQLWDLYQEELVYWCLTRLGFPMGLSAIGYLFYLLDSDPSHMVTAFLVIFPLLIATYSLFGIVMDIGKMDIVVVMAMIEAKTKEKPVRGWWDDYYVYWHNHSFNLKLSKEQWNPIVESTQYKITYLRRTQLVLKLEPYQA